MDTKNDCSEKATPSKIYLVLGIYVQFWVCIYLYLLHPKPWMEKHNRMQLKGHLLHVLSAVDFVDPGVLSEEKLWKNDRLGGGRSSTMHHGWMKISDIYPPGN